VRSFYLDVDGVLTDGTILYDSNGKSHKTFGPDDADALRLLHKHIHIKFVTADVRDFSITRARVEQDMGFKQWTPGIQKNEAYPNSPWILVKSISQNRGI